ncbi:hypothetical protein LX73_1394 [Fodinibius salinus]|uniref:Helix-hairpin-helix motif-containing protein n=1 Tax=Fodinibius salinus TaxID=860790 RepID=A0A5D3YJK2_9BACT|nr:hypothetical protein [Fodinibius salinus]TYP93685.1 hypothetical protein LX73_1394 [Fodinibius salinus]
MNTLLNNNISSALLMILVVTITACGGNTNKKEKTKTETKQRPSISQADSTATPDAKLNINTASGEAFQNIPNVGDNMEHEFEEYRPYVSIQQFRKEIAKYVDSSQVAAYEQYIFVPIHRNDSDAATVMQIPGLDKSETEELLAKRPFDSNQSFLDSLSSYVDEEELTTAESYLKTESE